MSKYYTPEIEEFHVGFEYEYRNIGEEWEVRSYPVDSYVHITQSLIDIDCIRVKYLDREDIESLFSNCNSEIEYYVSKQSVGDKSTGESWIEWLITDVSVFDPFVYSLIFLDDLNKVQVALLPRLKSDSYLHLFAGKIKNKSELGRVLKMVGVI